MKKHKVILSIFAFVFLVGTCFLGIIVKKNTNQKIGAAKNISISSKAIDQGLLTNRFDWDSASASNLTSSQKSVNDLIPKKYLDLSGNVLLVKKSRVIYQNGLGYSNAKVPYSPNATTGYRLCDLQYILNAGLIIKMAQQHHLSLSTDVESLLPTVKTLDNVTVKDLLQNKVAIKARHKNDIFSKNFATVHAHDLTLASVDSATLKSNLNTDQQIKLEQWLLGQLIEKKGGSYLGAVNGLAKNYGSLVNTVKMPKKFFNNSNLARSYAYKVKKDYTLDYDADDLTYGVAIVKNTNDLYAAPSDVYLLLKALHDNLSMKSFKLLNKVASDYALAFQMTQTQVGYNGGQSGYTNVLEIPFNKTNQGYIFMTNNSRIPDGLISTGNRMMKEFD